MRFPVRKNFFANPSGQDPAEESLKDSLARSSRHRTLRLVVEKPYSGVRRLSLAANDLRKRRCEVITLAGPWTRADAQARAH
eukprot:12708956-Alexandrium_andersonii.AAC.1